MAGAKRMIEMQRRLDVATAVVTRYLEPDEHLKNVAYGVKQPNVVLLVFLTALFIVPGLIATMLLTKKYLVGVTDRRFIVVPLFDDGTVKANEIADYRLDGLPRVVTSTGPLFTHIKIIDPKKPFVAKCHRYAFRGMNWENAMAVAAALTGSL